MNKKIASVWQKLEHNRLDLFNFLEKQDPSVFNQKPAPDKWSVNQTILHLIEAESASLQYMKKKLSFGTDLPKAGFKSHVRRFLLNVAFVLPLKFKAPPNLAKMPKNDLDFQTLKNKWAALRAEYLDLLNNLPENVFTAELWRHQIAGKMTLFQMIDFFDDHQSRHRGQIERTLKQVP